MTFIPQARIDERTGRLWGENKLAPNFDVEKLLDTLDLALLWSSLPPGIMAEISPYDRRVTVNEGMRVDFDRNTGLYRFTVAHEIGHWFLHAEGARSDTGQLFESNLVLCREEQKSDPAEVQANKFAAALLAPRDLLREAVPKSQWEGRSTVQQLAGTFGMSYQAMLFRLYELGLAHEGDDGVPRSGKKADPNQGSLFS
jgi:hypothetical protein